MALTQSPVENNIPEVQESCHLVDFDEVSVSHILQEVFDIGSEQGCRRNMEDTISMKRLLIDSIGDCIIISLNDGHSGVYAAETLEKYATNFLKKSLEKNVTSPLNHSEIIQSFRQTSVDLQKIMPDTSGSTAILTLIVLSTKFTYNLCLGDSTFNYSDRKTGNIHEGEIRLVDFDAKTEQEYNGQMINFHHQISGKVAIKQGIGNQFNPYCTKNYIVENDDENMTSWNEWVTWNKCFRENQNILFPRFSNGCWRMESIQPTRSYGNEQVLHGGQLYITKIEDLRNTRFVYYCDGPLDNDAISHENMAKFFIDESFLVKNYSDNHFIDGVIKRFLNSHSLSQIDKNKVTRIDSDSTFIEKVRWVANMVNNVVRRRLDNDWIRGTNESREYFESFGENPIPLDAKTLSMYCVSRMSGDNVTIGQLVFN